MKTKALEQEIAKRNSRLDVLAGRIINKPELLPQVFDGLEADTGRVKYGCMKLLRIVSEREVGVLHPQIGHFFELLDGQNTILRWGAIIIIGNLAAVDSARKIDGILTRYLKPISGPVMITAANVIGGAGKIAVAKPYLADRIAGALLRVERAHYQTAECRNVALGHAAEALDRAFDNLTRKRPVIAFVRRQLSNSRNAVQRKAAKFLKRHDALT